jgi:hypothetical protein
MLREKRRVFCYCQLTAICNVTGDTQLSLLQKSAVALSGSENSFRRSYVVRLSNVVIEITVLVGCDAM